MLEPQKLNTQLPPPTPKKSRKIEWESVASAIGTLIAILAVGGAIYWCATSDRIENVEKELKQAEAFEAVEIFLATQLEGWVLEGNTLDITDTSAYDKIPFDIQIKKGEKAKVIPVILQKFKKAGGSEYWFVYLGVSQRKRITELPEYELPDPY